MDSDIKKIESRIENLEKSIEEIKEALNNAFFEILVSIILVLVVIDKDINYFSLFFFLILEINSEKVSNSTSYEIPKP